MNYICKIQYIAQMTESFNTDSCTVFNAATWTQDNRAFSTRWWVYTQQHSTSALAPLFALYINM